MIEPIFSRIAEYLDAHDALVPGERVLVMVSGGADSVCLLHALVALHDGPIGVVTMDHGLRKESADEVRKVAAMAADLGLPCETVQLQIAPGSGVQARAREARYAAVRAYARRHQWDVIAVGHTASDQAETVLMRLARGVGGAGAGAMSVRRGDVLRPLLGVTRDETAAWCTAHGVWVATDPSNLDTRYARVRARELVARFDTLSPDATRHLVQFADRMRDEAEVIDEVVEHAWQHAWTGTGLDVDALTQAPGAVQRLLVRRLLTDAGIPADGRDARTVRRVCAIARDGGRIDIPGGTAVRAGGALYIHPASVRDPVGAALLVPGAVQFGARVVRGSFGIAQSPTRTQVSVRVQGEMWVRGPRDGDRIALPSGGHARVGRILQADGVPAVRRPHVPVIVVDDVPVWVAGHRVDHGVLASPGESAVVLEVVPA